MSIRLHRLRIALGLILLVQSPSLGALVKATYRFQNTLAADEPSAPALIPTDPLLLNHFESDVVFGQARQVYVVDGFASPVTQQAGLTLPTAGLLTSDSYSVELVFEFLERTGAWRRIVDVENRQSDNGFYVDPSNRLDIFPIAGSINSFATTVYYHVVLTNDHGTARAYLNGQPQIIIASNIMNIANVNNPGLLMHLFLDNIVAGGQAEFSDAKIALARFWDGSLTDAEVLQLATDPLAACNMFAGDVNEDGHVDTGDTEAFVAVLLGLNTNSERVSRADMNCDGRADGQDIRAFVGAIFGP